LYFVSCTRITTVKTLLVTAMSAVVGLIETAPSDQFEEPLKVSEIGTLGAPDLLLPVPRTSGGETGGAKLSAFHRET
jgi:hypothetical protein